MKKTFALLVGINNYAPPISSLSGCIKDVDRIESYLRKTVGRGEETKLETHGIHFRTYGPLHLCCLTDEQATYHNITAAFKSFLRLAGPDDVAWFHFSGHGSEEFTAEEFLALEPNGKDQTLICYRAGQEDGYLHLADKELAVLLHEVSTKDRAGQIKKSPHLVVSLDCCHSGSGTRDVSEDPDYRTRGIVMEMAHPGMKVRGQGVSGRPLDTYAGGYYAQQWREKRSLEVPESRHVLLSACESIQEAGDLRSGGVFTSSLITTLEQAGGELNYADLFVRTRATAHKIRWAQTPQFEAIGNFDPYTRFLEGSSLGTPDRFEVVYEEGHWFVKCGAIHGLPVKTGIRIEIEIQTAAPENKPITKAFLNGIGAQKSRFTLSEGGLLKSGEFYQAVIRFLPAPPVFVWLHGDQEGVQLLKDHWDASKNVQWTDNPDQPDTASLEVESNGSHFVLHDRRRGSHVWSRPQDTTNVRLIIDSLGKMVRWERTVRLDNPKSKLRQSISFELGVADKKMQKTFFTAPEIRLYVDKDKYFYDPNTQAIGVPYFPNIIIKDTSRTLYAYMFHLRSNYSIESYEGEVVFRPAEHPGKQTLKIPMWKKTMGWGLSPNEEESTSYFKLLVTSAPLDYQQLLQSGIGADRSGRKAWKPVAVDDAWASYTVKVTMIRTRLSLNEGLPLARGTINLLPHPGVSARLSVVAACTDEYSADPCGQFTYLQSPAMRLLDFRPSSAKLPQQVLELTDLKLEPGASLIDEPVEVSNLPTLEAQEMYLAIAFDGQHYRLIGDAYPGEDPCILRLKELPEHRQHLPAGEEFVAKPFNPADLQHRSLFKALKIAIFKLDLSKVDLQQLFWVDFEGQAGPQLEKAGIIEKITQASNIILLLPAIISVPKDTNSYWQNLLQLKKDNLLEKYDLVLCFNFRYTADLEYHSKMAFAAEDLSKVRASFFWVVD